MRKASPRESVRAATAAKAANGVAHAATKLNALMATTSRASQT